MTTQFPFNYRINSILSDAPTCLIAEVRTTKEVTESHQTHSYDPMSTVVTLTSLITICFNQIHVKLPAHHSRSADHIHRSHQSLYSQKDFLRQTAQPPASQTACIVHVIPQQTRELPKPFFANRCNSTIGITYK